MIDLVYKTLLTILNKENKGYVDPTEFNLIANNIQNEIYREYFSDVNRDITRQKAGQISQGYANLAFNERQRITKFAASSDITKQEGENFISLPSNMYLLEQDGITVTATGRVIEETERAKLGYLLRSKDAAPTEVFPVYEQVDNTVFVYPTSIENITVRYLRVPVPPQWTYVSINNQPIFNPSSSSYQDFELHESEFSNIVVRMLSLFGVVIRDTEVVQIAENMKNTNEIKDNQ